MAEKRLYPNNHILDHFDFRAVESHAAAAHHPLQPRLGHPRHTVFPDRLRGADRAGADRFHANAYSCRFYLSSRYFISLSKPLPILDLIAANRICFE